MLRKFKITIDGTEYLVEMEEIGGTPAPAVPVAASVRQPSPVTMAAPIPTPVASQNTVGDTLPAPMPGSILKLLVKVGDEVKENQPLIILEAMKMENEVVANHAGKVSAINVAVGENVNAGDALITIQ
ncbi:acetyl-CoA carboxylase biotin carboxyl carrier protein subunit [Loigolactobacillus coryniformis]|uniref:acetyl-CoA carboxylase biotin carboxyl carrier protein subunit n=1 Tax=Loigolactobacillus coryniformis TaxID=1610 RepID=UPI0023404AA1|nr:acetyl-CoA carboxylase biotin carboxyl carrier protein subunit [Loigolactobacillus coryniformis]MDC4185471.1 acetyl-CoA carboxylase biotin carboxyl carrier protein subunit [Loigolactobacillus coryniformis]